MNSDLQTYYLARRDALRGEPNTEEMLPEGDARRLHRSVIDDWEAPDRDLGHPGYPAMLKRFARVCEEVAANTNNPPWLRALAFEHRSSCELRGPGIPRADGQPKSSQERQDAYREWTDAGIELLAQMGPRDRETIRSALAVGVWKHGLKSVPWDDVEESIGRSVDNGDFNAPANSLWLVDALQTRDPDGWRPRALVVLSRVIDRADSGTPHGFREDRLQACRHKYAELAVD